MSADLPFIHLHVLHEPPPILHGFLGHAQPYNEGQRGDHADGGEGRDWGEREDGGEEEVNVRDPPELFKNGLGEEGYDVVLGGGDIVRWVAERFPAVEAGLVAVHGAGESWTLESIEGIDGVGGIGIRTGTVEGVELAPPEPFLPKFSPDLPPRHLSVSLQILFQEGSRGDKRGGQNLCMFAFRH